MSKRYCNVKSCAVIALFTHKVLNVANVGDYAAVLRLRNTETPALRAHEVAANHSCYNLHDTNLLTERSHNRNSNSTIYGES